MKKPHQNLIFLLISLLIFPLSGFRNSEDLIEVNLSMIGDNEVNAPAVTEALVFDLQLRQLYEEFELDGILEQDAFKSAIIGYWNLRGNEQLLNTRFLAVADFTMSSSKERLVILDMENRSVFFQTYVAHGKNSGSEYARSFSNTPNTRKSSRGFFVTGMPYNGKHRYSLKLNGKDAYYNTNAHNRGIVIHGADYADYEFLEWNNHLGRSYGCPAIPKEYNQMIVDILKGGSCFYIYTNDARYQSRSVWLNLEKAAGFFYNQESSEKELSTASN